MFARARRPHRGAFLWLGAVSLLWLALVVGLPHAFGAEATLGKFCAGYADLVAELGGAEFKQVPIFFGTVGEGPESIVIFVAADGSWTLVRRPRPEIGCLVVMGEHAKPSETLSPSN